MASASPYELKHCPIDALFDLHRPEGDVWSGFKKGPTLTINDVLFLFSSSLYSKWNNEDAMSSVENTFALAF